jgi:hypothetical protein
MSALNMRASNLEPNDSGGHVTCSPSSFAPHYRPRASGRVWGSRKMCVAGHAADQCAHCSERGR